MDFLEKLKESAKSIPAYNNLVEYLTQQKAMPTIEKSYLSPGTNGQFNLDERKLSLNREFETRDGFTPKALQTLIHELTHATALPLAQQFAAQQREGNNFTDAYKKLMFGRQGSAYRYPRTEMVDKMAPGWGPQKEAYRASQDELSAFALGNAAGPIAPQNNSNAAPAHIDPTLATEFEILLDLAKRNHKVSP